MKRVLFLLLILASSARAQTLVEGGSIAEGSTIVNGTSPRGTIVEGNSILMGGTLLDPRTSKVRIFAIYPPEYSVATPNFASFVANVMTQQSIDGVDVPITWSQIEPPDCGMPTGCVSPSLSMLGNCTTYTNFDTDTCVKDAAGYFHNYTWGSYENGCMTNNNLQVWFGLCGGFSGHKTVNLYFIGIDAGLFNESTPEYVANSAGAIGYANASYFSPPGQDVLNMLNQAQCPTLQQWTGYTGYGLTVAPAGGGMVTVSGSLPTAGTYTAPWKTGDLIWIGNTGNCDTKHPLTTSPTPGVSISVSGSGFTSSAYTPNGSPCNSALNATLIGTPDSFAIPYEQPYVTAYRAALTALFLHFNANYTLSSNVVGQQLGYVRFGLAVGGEAYPYCPAYMYNNLASPYNFGGSKYMWRCEWTGYTSADYGPGGSCAGLGFMSPNPGYYGGSLQWAESKAPYMRIYAPLNQYGGASDPDANLYGMREAEQAAMYTNGRGGRDGFGSQDATLSDTSAGNLGCAQSVSYWCLAFQTYYATGAPLELQQGGLSDPQDSICAPPLSVTTSLCGQPPVGDAGDLRMWLPLEVGSHANVIELFYLDAALAYDPGYINYNVTSPSTGTFLTPALQTQFFNLVGQGGTCNIHGSGSGDCSYAATIDAVHALH